MYIHINRLALRSVISASVGPAKEYAKAPNRGWGLGFRLCGPNVGDIQRFWGPMWYRL